MLRLLGILALGNLIFGDNRHRRNGSFLGGLFILPALMFGGWIAIAVIGGVLGLVGSIIGGIFSGLTSLASSAFSGSGVVVGIVIGFALYFWLKKRNEAKEEESSSTVDGETVETEIVEPPVSSNELLRQKLTAPVITETGTGFDIWSRIQFPAPSFSLVAQEATNYYIKTGILFAEGGDGVKDKGKLTYTPGMFHLYMITDALDFWDEFPEKMWDLGFEMDCCNSFEEYRKNSKLKLKEPHSKREEYKNILYLLEHADRQIVGNYLFSEWRYFTHWSYGWDHYDVDFLRRIIRILETKYNEESK